MLPWEKCGKWHNLQKATFLRPSGEAMPPRSPKAALSFMFDRAFSIITHPTAVFASYYKFACESDVRLFIQPQYCVATWFCLAEGFEGNLEFLYAEPTNAEPTRLSRQLVLSLASNPWGFLSCTNKYASPYYCWSCLYIRSEKRDKVLFLHQQVTELIYFWVIIFLIKIT